jgi:hypothetical protein
VNVINHYYYYLWDLAKKNNHFLWCPEHQSAVGKIKAMITSSSSLQYFDDSQSLSKLMLLSVAEPRFKKTVLWNIVASFSRTQKPGTPISREKR